MNACIFRTYPEFYLHVQVFTCYQLGDYKMNLSKYMLLCCLGAAAFVPDTACAHSKKHHHCHSNHHTKNKCPQKCASPAFTKRGLHIYKDFVENEIIDSQVAPGWGTVAVADGKIFVSVK